MMDNQASLNLLEMETKLEEDQDGSYCRQLCGELQSYADAIRRRSKTGLPPAEYVMAEKLLTALAAAQETIQLHHDAAACFAAG
jgi:hypothetical protein